MKKIFTTFFIVYISITSFCQISNNQINDLIKTLKAGGVSNEEIRNTVNGIIINPELYNTLWKNFFDQKLDQDSSKWKLLKDLNIQFITFQSTDNPSSSIGFTYDFNYDYAKDAEINNKRTYNSFGLSAKGNVAFNKQFNPVDFLETKVHYDYSHFIGGVVTQTDTAIYTELNNIRFKLAGIKDMQSDEAVKLWEQLGKKLIMSNQYYFAFSPKFAMESNQDFSKKQVTPGLTVNLGAKAWSENNTLSYFNIFDYPFALLRLLTGTDKKFTIYGSTIPIVQIAFDYVIPLTDTTRQNLVGNIDPFSRIKFETSFRTFIARVKKENIFFNANYRYYQELNAPEVITKSNLSTNSYFVIALQSSSGFYVSYTNGKLPFDSKNDEVYSIGFNYKFN